jgi:hypothetical protein
LKQNPPIQEEKFVSTPSPQEIVFDFFACSRRRVVELSWFLLEEEVVELFRFICLGDVDKCLG